MKKLIGPFAQVLTMNGLSQKGPLKDEQMEVIPNGGILTENGIILDVDSFSELKGNENIEIEWVAEEQVVLPGFIDTHTHICFSGSRAKDFAARNNGKTYQEIAKIGGGIWDTVIQTREATPTELTTQMLKRLDQLARNGVTTVEVKSGYGLSINDELKMLHAIKKANTHPIDTVVTCLAAHIIPREFDSQEAYLESILTNLLPEVKQENLAQRFDIFIEENAFSGEASMRYLTKIKNEGFEITVHGDQFTTGGSQMAIDCGAVSVDHLEASTEKEIMALAKSEVIPTALPGASIGLGCAFAPARKLLDAGCALVIASDWNPGSAPQGYLLNQASILSTYEKLSAAEIFAGMTFRAAKALKLSDRGTLAKGTIADLVSFPTGDYREILYHQGELRAASTWKKGKKI